jgi:hypothetical protein
LESRKKRSEFGLVRFVCNEREPAALRFGGDHPAIDELEVHTEIGRDDADHLRDVGGDQLLVERVGAAEERRAGKHRFDHAVARDARHADAIAAGGGSR